MLLKDCATYVSDRIDSIHLSDTTYISTDNMLPDRRGIEPSSCVPNKGNVTAFKPGDILLSNIRPYFKKIWLADRSGGCCADVLVLRADRRKILPEILYLILSQDSFFEYVMAGAKGSKMPRGDKDRIMNYPISKVNSIDVISKWNMDVKSKIETNNAIISELESMAKDIYDYWFVQFDFPDENGKPYKSSGGKMVWNEELKRDIPEGWKADRLGCLISKISTGLNPRDNFKFVDKGIDYYTVKNLCVDGHLDNSGCDHIDRSAQSIIHERSNISIGDILYASIAPLGRTYLITDAPENWEINESIFSIRPNTDKTTSVFLQMYLKSEYLIKLFEQCSVGSIFKGVRIDMLQNSVVLIPSFSIVNKFTNQIKDIVMMQHHKWKENAELTSLRDFLLPLLMNGQVKIGDVSD